jgi:signal transduction histidine kinase/AmiR/NasT family two-component response regulator
MSIDDTHDTSHTGKAPAATAMERHSICFPRPGTKTILEKGSQGFRDELRRLYATDENNALESLIELKTHLRTLSNTDYWSAATEGLSKLLGAEITFVMKRMLVDDHDTAVEMPPLGETGSCLMAAALHYCTLDGSKHTVKETKFHAYGCPCAYMRHDKVFLIPEALNDFITDNPNAMPFPAEAYIAVPLFIEGKCVAHFGAMWSKPGAERRTLSWAFIEMMMHAMEDMMVQRLQEGSNFVRPAPASEKPVVIPHEAVTMAQSLRPYAGSLSHELRTPMQGVVGMLDVMYATVREAVMTQSDPHLRQVFANLQENIEVVQDSSRRAVEAADNVVHAYDMDMSVPDAPPNLPEDELAEITFPFSNNYNDRRPEILVAGSNLPLARPNKRRRDESRNPSNASQPKSARIDDDMVWARGAKPSREMEEGVHEAEEVQTNAQPDAGPAYQAVQEIVGNPSRIVAPGLRHAHIREVLQYVINEGLKLGGRPDSAMAQETDFGEIIEVRTRGSDGTASRKIIEWDVDPNLPETMFIDEKDLSKLVSCVFLNAIKFTDPQDGHVGLHARMSSRGKYVSIKVTDNGPGIPAAFLPKLFKAFSQQNGSLTRSSEGLGLGLMVAKGIARKLGGDLMCIRADTAEMHHGSEFEIRIPLNPGDIVSRPASPFGSPLPRRANLANLDVPGNPVLPAPRASSPWRTFNALQQAVADDGTGRSTLGNSSPSSTPSPRTYPTLQVNSNRSVSPPCAPPQSLPAKRRPRMRKSVSNPEIDSNLAAKYPLTFLVAEDNKINRKLLVNMLSKFGYRNIFEAHDGAEAVRQMSLPRAHHEQIDVVLMDLWMPLMDGYEATERILSMHRGKSGVNGGMNGASHGPTVLAVTADVTDGALDRAARVGMKGFMTKPYKLMDLQRLITEYCARNQAEAAM